MDGEPLLRVRELRVAVRDVAVVRGLTFDVAAGEMLAVVGESGAGKSLAARAVLGLSPPGARISGSVRLDGVELVGARREVYRGLFGRRMAFVPQDALSVLSPVHTVGDQLALAVRCVRGLGRKPAWAHAVAALDRVGIPDAARRARAYPHEFSGGMRQRAVIAMATVNDPAMVIADEPTTALDPTVQARILRMLDDLREESGMAVVLVTHDLAVAAAHADRVLVLHKGQHVESGPVGQVLTRPRAAYTAALLAAQPGSAARDRGMTTPVLEVDDLTVRYPGRGRRTPPVLAVDRVSFTVHVGETLALVGESGSGKSSIATAAMMLRKPEAGRVRFDGHDLTGLDERALRAIRPGLQPVFQDPYGSLSPRKTIHDTIAEPLRVQGRWDPSTGAARVAELLDLVHLDASLARRRPHELSGGQCQRVGIARALASEPKLLVLDEPVSAVDSSVRAGIVDLLTELQEHLGLAQLFICHDLTLVRHIAHRVAVLHHGQIVESGPARDVCDTPTHPYARELLASVPDLRPPPR